MMRMHTYHCPRCGEALARQPLRIGPLSLPWFGRLVCDRCGLTVRTGTGLLAVVGLIAAASLAAIVVASFAILALIVAVPVLGYLAARVWILRRRLSKASPRQDRIIDVKIIDDHHGDRTLP
ncbi:MAG: hypothetical protein ABFD92_12450 [Planctomycetaceae bacterium]|nr:hypothetical protein [Planctomycetaceae bacterium]